MSARKIDSLVRLGGSHIKLTEAAYTEQIRDRLEKSLPKQDMELGCTLTNIDPPPKELKSTNT